MSKQPCVYILASRRNGTLYVGMTLDLKKRVKKHRYAAPNHFTKLYNVHHLVWYEEHATKESAALREKRIKRWRRGWKITLIEKFNENWRDLYEDLI